MTCRINLRLRLPIRALVACMVWWSFADSLCAQGLPALKVPAIVYELQEDGSGWKKVFTPGDFTRIGSLRLSPDGTRLCFDGIRNGDPWSAAMLLTCRPDGSDLKVHGKGAMPNLSPDGKRLSYCDYEAYAVRVLDLETSQSSSIEKGWGVQWSPVANQIAYVVQGGVVVIRDLDRGERRLLFPGETSPYRSVSYNMAWSHDGRQLAIQGQRADGTREIAVVDAQGAEFGYRVIAPLAALSSFLAFHPDGGQVAFQSYVTGNKCSQLFVVDAHKGGEPVRIQGQPDDFDNVSACWVDGGRKLLVISWQR